MSVPTTPTADEIALVLVRAAKALGENAELVAQGVTPNSRAGYHALRALAHSFPGWDPRPVAGVWALGWHDDSATVLSLPYYAGQVVDLALIVDLVDALEAHHRWGRA